MQKLSSSDVLNKLKIALNVDSDTDLCNEINMICNEDVRRSTLGSWRSRDAIPYAICVKIADKKGFSLDWLLRDQGEMRKNVSTPIEPQVGRKALKMAEMFESLDDVTQQEILAAVERAKQMSQLAEEVSQLRKQVNRRVAA